MVIGILVSSLAEWLTGFVFIHASLSSGVLCLSPVHDNMHGTQRISPDMTLAA